jgi:hypothetical protein
MMRRLILLLFFGFVGGSIGCSKGVPKIESAESESAITLMKTVFATKNPSNLDLNVGGTCARFVSSFEVTDGSNWVTPASLGGTVTNDCLTNGTFTMRIPSIGSGLGAIGALPAGSSGTVRVRGVSEYGPTSQATLQITRLTSAYTIRSKMEGTTSMVPGELASNLKSNALKPLRVVTGGYKIRSGLR